LFDKERPNESIDMSNTACVFFISAFDNRRAGLWVIKLKDWNAQAWSDDGEKNALAEIEANIGSIQPEQHLL